MTCSRDDACTNATCVQGPAKPADNSADVVGAIITALQQGAAACSARVREPDAEHSGDWVCTWLDALDAVKDVLAQHRSRALHAVLAAEYRPEDFVPLPAPRVLAEKGEYDSPVAPGPPLPLSASAGDPQGGSRAQTGAESALAVARRRIINTVDPVMSGVKVKQAVLDLLDALAPDPGGLHSTYAADDALVPGGTCTSTCTTPIVDVQDSDGYTQPDGPSQTTAAAVAEHDACIARWDRLSPEQRSGTTFHGADAHLRRETR